MGLACGNPQSTPSFDCKLRVIYHVRGVKGEAAYRNRKSCMRPQNLTHVRYYSLGLRYIIRTGNMTHSQDRYGECPKGRK